jgi:hypothetical protein
MGHYFSDGLWGLVVVGKRLTSLGALLVSRYLVSGHSPEPSARAASIAIVSAAPRRYAAWSRSAETEASTVRSCSAALVRSVAPWWTPLVDVDSLVLASVRRLLDAT